MARNTGKALDDVLDWANEYKGKIDMALVRLDMFREQPHTEGELVIINTMSHLLRNTDKPKP